MDWTKIEYVSALQQDPAWKTIQSGSVTGGPLPDTPDTSQLSDFSQLDEFKYAPLNKEQREIRVVYIHPVKRNGQGILSISSLTVSMDNNPFYLALSYAWGTADDLHIVLLDGCRFRVSTNLFAALQQLGSYGLTIPIWIDAICINQRNRTEKSSQVQQMGEIYSKAQFVIGYIGPGSTYSGLALNALAFAGRNAKYFPFTPMLMAAFSRDIPREYVLSDDERPKAAVGFFSEFLPLREVANRDPWQVRVVQELLERPWFQRLWVVQEIVLAKRCYVLCGAYDVSFRELQTGALFVSQASAMNDFSKGAMREQAALATAMIPHHIEFFFLETYSGKKANLRFLLTTSCILEAKDEKDYVYALLSMADDDPPLGIQVDYTASWQQVYQDVAAAFINIHKDLDILRLCSAKTSTTTSWVPDWRLLDMLKPNVWYVSWASTWTVYNACGPNNTAYAHASGGLLAAKGVRLGSVYTVGRVWDTQCQVNEFITDLEDFARAECTAYLSEEAMEDAIWRTCIADIRYGRERDGTND